MAFAEKYVTVTGGGLHDGSSEANAWTFDEAYANHVTGDRINMKAGTYTLTQAMTVWQSGTNSSPISWRGYKTTIGDLDSRPTSQLVDGTDLPLIQTTNSSYYFYPQSSKSLWENLSFKATVARPAAYVRTSNSIWRRCRFSSDDSVNGLINRFRDYAIFQECHFTSPSGTASVSCGYSTILCQCVFDGIASIVASRFLDLTECIIRNTTADAVVCNGYGSFSLRNNTFYNIDGDGISFGSVFPAFSPSLVVNNVFHTVSGDAIQANSTSLFQCINQNNLFYNVTGSNFANDGFGMSRDEQNDSTDPFVDAANGDYSLVSGSNGYNNAASKPFEVFDVNSNRDIGAIQHQDPAYVAPPDASATTKIFPFRSWVEGDFQQEGADADEFVEKHELQALPVFEFSIGTGANRDYNSLTAFFAAFDNTLVNVPNSKVVVTCYNDTGADQWIAETSPLTVSSPTNCLEFVLTVDDDSWHKGDPSKGVALKFSSVQGSSLLSIGAMNGAKLLVERLVIDANAQLGGDLYLPAVVSITNGASTSYIPVPANVFKNLIIRGGDGTANYSRGLNGFSGGSRPALLDGCIVENIVCNGSSNSATSVGISAYFRSTVKNCTVNNVDFTNTTGTNLGIDGPTDATYGFVNECISTNVNGDCFGASLANTSNLIADDATGTIQSTAAGEFVDAANSDYKLKGTASSAGIVTATDAKVTDITGKLRKAGVAQDAGAFNNVAGYDDSPVFPPDQPTDPIIHPLRSN